MLTKKNIKPAIFPAIIFGSIHSVTVEEAIA